MKKYKPTYINFLSFLNTKMAQVTEYILIEEQNYPTRSLSKRVLITVMS